MSAPPPDPAGDHHRRRDRILTPTVAMCRDQQAYHRARAEQTTLENVRTVAIKAAIAWEQEAKRAALREANGERRRVHATAAAMAIVGDEPWPNADERQASENPDRGCTSE